MVWLMAPSRSQDSRRMWETHSRNSLGPENVQVVLGNPKNPNIDLPHASENSVTYNSLVGSQASSDLDEALHIV